MEKINFLLADPIIQLIIFAVLFVCVMDGFKFILLWAHKMMGGKDGDE
tara:strand:+ start:351 stop:494 length:144 start_codon:yes stop_codon:yes gene_type:complete